MASKRQRRLKKGGPEEDCKQQFSASENHFLEPLPLHKAPALEEDGKNDFRQAKKTLHKAPALKEDGKNDFRQAKITFWGPDPSTRHLLWGKMVKTIFGKQKSLFGALTPPQGTSSGGRWSKTIFGKRKSLLEPLPFRKAPALEEDGKKRFSAIN